MTKQEEFMALALKYGELATKLEKAHHALREKAARGEDVIEDTVALIALDAEVRDLGVEMKRLRVEADRLS